MAKVTYTYKSYPNCPRATEYSKERERQAVHLNSLAGILSIGAIISFFICTFSLFSDGNWIDFSFAIFFASLIALFDAYVFVMRAKNTECKLNIILFEESLLMKMNHHKEQMQTLEKENRKEQLLYLKQNYIEQMDIFKQEKRKETRKENITFLKRYFLYFFLGLFVAISIVGIIQGLVFIANGDDAIMLLFSIIAFLSLSFLFFCTLPIGKKLFEKKKLHKTILSPIYSSEEKLFCRKCGAQLMTDSLFCNKCGTKVETL